MRLKSFLVEFWRRQAGNVAVLSLMIKKRRLIKLWLKTARKAQLTLAIGISALIFVAPVSATWLSDVLYPTQYEQQGPFQRLLDLQRPVALKQLFSHLVADPEQSSRFRQEALALASLAHPHIVTIYDLVEFERHFWIVMELLTGGSLADRIDARGSIPAAETIDIACELANALDYAHKRGIVHRDVKPMNVLFTADGKPKLTDFGNAKLRETAIQTREGHLIGSPAFMSPEQISGTAIDFRTDIYSLGVSIYQMLTGQVPFDGELSSILAQHVQRRPDPPSARVDVPGISPALDQLVLKMLEKTPESRFADCSEVVAALRNAAQSVGRRRRA